MVLKLSPVKPVQLSDQAGQLSDAVGLEKGDRGYIKKLKRRTNTSKERIQQNDRSVI